MRHLSDAEFETLKRKYDEYNNQYKQSMIFHVGVFGGFYSEVVSMMECMCFCHLHHLKFILYADDANFAENGWEDFFEPFCEQSHDVKNKKYNLRYRPEKIVRRCIYDMGKRSLKKRNSVDYVTDDFFIDFISKEFKNTTIKWDLFGINGTVYPEISKLFPFATRYNSEIRRNVDELLKNLNLPEDYVSIQIRGGDKISERSRLLGVKECREIIEKSGVPVSNLFVFTDDYNNIRYLQENTDWIIYSLTGSDECGYVNTDFQRQSWAFRKKNTIKLFAMVEACIDSRFHFGYEAACVNNYIKVCKDKSSYYPMYDGDD